VFSETKIRLIQPVIMTLNRTANHIYDADPLTTKAAINTDPLSWQVVNRGKNGTEVYLNCDCAAVVTSYGCDRWYC